MILTMDRPRGDPFPASEGSSFFAGDIVARWDLSSAAADTCDRMRRVA